MSATIRCLPWSQAPAYLRERSATRRERHVFFLRDQAALDAWKESATIAAGERMRAGCAQEFVLSVDDDPDYDFAVVLSALPTPARSIAAARSIAIDSSSGNLRRVAGGRT